MKITLLELSFARHLILIVASLLGGVGLTVLDGSFKSESFFEVSLFSATYTTALIYTYWSIQKFKHYKKHRNEHPFKSVLALWLVTAMLFVLPIFLNEKPTGIFSTGYLSSSQSTPKI